MLTVLSLLLCFSLSSGAKIGKEEETALPLKSGKVILDDSERVRALISEANVGGKPHPTGALPLVEGFFAIRSLIAVCRAMSGLAERASRPKAKVSTRRTSSSSLHVS